MQNLDVCIEVHAIFKNVHKKRKKNLKSGF